MEYFKGNRVKILANILTSEDVKQIKQIAESEAYKDCKIRIMPDCHAGAGSVVGTTIKLKDKVTPNLVGVDIGCGMLTVVLREKEKEVDLKKLDEVIRKHIPSGRDIHDEPVKTFSLDGLKAKRVNTEKAMRSIGTLGGGNHFIELAKDTKGFLYLIIHSGSRNIGHQVAKYHQDRAYKLLTDMSEKKKELISRLKKEGREKEINAELKKLKPSKVNKDLAYLTGKTLEDYLNDMYIMTEFASMNRETIASIIIREMNLTKTFHFETIHNYIGKDGILRKGAISARKGELVLIPLNMRDGSIIGIGKGNEDWNYSAPHGAGRVMSRSKAKELVNLEDYKKQMVGIYTTSVNEHTIDEAPSVYKPKKEILNLVKETVDILGIIKPIYNFKANT